MKIDIHTHTKKCKTGDPPTREIAPPNFCEAVRSTEVGIIAITNHNHFDLQQYKDILKEMGDDAQVWPGIELDVIDNGARGHLLVIVSPKKVDEFSSVVDSITEAFTADTFTTTIEQVLEKFDDLDPLYIAHYKQKTPNISDEALEKLIAGTSNPRHVIKEVANSISAGIYISHGHASIYGSDVQDWSTYEQQARDLPDLRLPVESFEHFCLLLEKDQTTINTVLDKKIAEALVLDPFNDGESLKFAVFNDINVIFGPKGTGKSCILKAIAKHYCDNGIDANVYESASDKLDAIFDIKGRDLSLNLAPYHINYCKDEIEFLRSAVEVNVTSLSKYVGHFQSKRISTNAKRIKIKDIEPEEELNSRREFSEFNDAIEKTGSFLSFLKINKPIRKVLNENEFKEADRIISDLLDRLNNTKWHNFTAWTEIRLLNSAVAKFRSEIERKSGVPAKPITTGFREYASNRLKIEANASQIIESFDTGIPVIKEPIGNLGPDKGNLELRTEFKFQDGTVIDGASGTLKKIKKASLKEFAATVRLIHKHCYQDNLFHFMTVLNSVEQIEEIQTVYELLLFKRYFAIDNNQYSPSSGEASMVMLQKELTTDKEVYILDEPERSLGNEYINDVIVPMIKEHARAGKKIFISTHDANIAVRTLPYSSIYRCHGKGGYTTYTGNPFSNKLSNLKDASDTLEWKKVSMRTLEGGEEAFGERGKIYGNR